MGNFNKVVIKNLKKHAKGAWLTAVGTKEGLCFLPFVNKDKNIMFKTPPVKVEDCLDGVAYQIEDYGMIGKMADVIDFEKDVKTTIKDGRQYLCVGQAEYEMKEVQWYDEETSKLLSIDGYLNHVTVQTEASQKIKQIAVCASDDKNRYFLRGVALTPDGYAVATDGCRMAYAKLFTGAFRNPGDFTTNFQAGERDSGLQKCGFMIPKELAPFMSDVYNTFCWSMHTKTRKTYEGKDEAYITSHSYFLMVTAEGYEYYYQPIEGQFPQFRKIIPDYDSIQDVAQVELDLTKLKYQKETLPRLHFEEDKCWQTHAGLQLNFPLNLKLGENYRMVVNARYIEDLKDIFGKKFSGSFMFSREAAIGSDATGYDIVKSVCFTSKEQKPEDISVIIMPLNPEY